MQQARESERASEPAIFVDLHRGIPALLDDLAVRAAPSHRFLRAGWYRMAAGEGAATIAALRGDGTAVAALPTAPLGPTLIGARSVPGSYWPFRSVPLDPDVTDEELTAFFAHPVSISALGPAWRIGPIYADDPATARIKRAAAVAGWTVLTRKLGRTFLFDARDEAWPRRSTRRRLANYERQLEQLGAVAIRHVSGEDWSSAVLDDLAAIEAASYECHVVMQAEYDAKNPAALAQPELAGYAPKPHYRPLTKFENRGIKLGHGVWDVVFERV